MTAETNDPRPVGVVIRCSLLFALFAEGEYQVKLPAGNASISLKRVKHKIFDPRLGIEAGDFDARGDRFGFVSYSQASIKLDWQTFNQIHRYVGGRSEDAVFRRVTQSVINHVIDAYRKVTQEPWVRRVTEWELFELESEVTRSDGVVECSKTMSAPGYGITLPCEGLSQESLQEFSQAIERPVPLPLWDNLWLDCEDAFQRGDYASVVIWGHSAIETLSHATVLSWLGEQNVGVDKAAELVARNSSHAGKLKQCLSIEEILENLNDTHKVEIALLRVMNADPSWGFDFCSRFERLAALRNEVLHLGASVSPEETRDHLEIIRTIRAHLVHRVNTERIQNYKALLARQALLSLSGKEINPKLAELLSEIESLGKDITIYSIARYPIWLHKQSILVAIIDGKSSMRIYLPKKSQLTRTAWEIELTSLLFRRRMITQEGWPEADVADRDANGKLSLGPFNWEGYRVVAVNITETILDIQINERLIESGFNTKLRINKQLNELEKYIEGTDFKAPKWGELDYYRLPLKALKFHIIAPDESVKLLQLLHDRTPVQSQKEGRMFEVVSKVGWNTPQSSATAMLVIKNELGLLDAMGVREPPKGALRTRLTDDERRSLGR